MGYYSSFGKRSKHGYSNVIKSHQDKMGYQDLYGFTEFSNATVMKLKYADHTYSKPASSGSPRYNWYVGNGIVQPVLNSGTSVYQMDQIDNAYASYFVIGSRFKFNAVYMCTGGTGAFTISIFPQEYSLAGAGPSYSQSQIDVQPYVTKYIIWTTSNAQKGGINNVIFNEYFATSKIILEATRPQLTGLTGPKGSPGTYPSRGWLWTLQSYNPTGQNATTNGDLVIEYTTILFGRKTQTGSE